MPTPNTSSSTPCIEVCAVRTSSRKACTGSMKVDERCVVRSSATPASSAAASIWGGTSSPLVTTRQATSWAKNWRSTASARSRGSVAR